MNKNFIIAGASAQEQAAVMYQLTQAMASGRLKEMSLEVLLKTLHY